MLFNNKFKFKLTSLNTKYDKYDKNLYDIINNKLDITEFNVLYFKYLKITNMNKLITKKIIVFVKSICVYTISYNKPNIVPIAIILLLFFKSGYDTINDIKVNKGMNKLSLPKKREIIPSTKKEKIFIKIIYQYHPFLRQIHS